MINCICVDRDKKSREVIERMIRNIKELHLTKSYSALDSAFHNCKANDIKVLFISLHDFPIRKEDISLLNKIVKYETKIIIMSSRIKVVADAVAFDVSDYILFPTSSRRLWKGVKKALYISDFGIEIRGIRTEHVANTKFELLTN